jgi:hypothetical protein
MRCRFEQTPALCATEPGPWRRLLTGALACVLGLPAAAWAAGPAPENGSRIANNITGTWASTTGAERLIFLPGGYFRTCFAGGKPGNASMGQWKRLSVGRYAIEFTHTAKAACNAPPQPIRKHRASILGQVLVSKGELALYVSGEFPPDLYRPISSAALK